MSLFVAVMPISTYDLFMLQPIYIQLTPSNSMLGLLSSISILAGAITLTLPISPFLKIMIIALIGFASIYFILRDALRVLPWSWQTLEVNAMGELKLTNRRGQILQPQLADSSFNHPYLIILNFKQTFYSIVPTPSILLTCHDANDLRRLRVWLRWWPHQMADSLEELENAS